MNFQQLYHRCTPNRYTAIELRIIFLHVHIQTHTHTHTYKYMDTYQMQVDTSYTVYSVCLKIQFLVAVRSMHNDANSNTKICLSFPQQLY